MSGPRWSWLLALALAIVGIVALATRPVAPSVPPPEALGPLADQLTSFDRATRESIAAWTGPLRVARLVAIGLRLVVAVLLVGTPRGRELLGRIGGGPGRVWLGAATVVVVLALVTAPLRIWIGWFHAGAFGFRTSTPVRFGLEWLGEVAVEVLVTATAAALLVGLVGRRPRDWPALGAIGGTVLTALLALATPLVVTEVLLAPEPLPDGEVAAVVRPVLAASDVDTQTIEVGAASVRTTRANAFVTGVGPTRRVVLYDTLLERPPDVVASVVAHELAHAESFDVERGVVASGAGLLVALLLGRRALRAAERAGVQLAPATLGAAVAAGAVVLQLVVAPVIAWESRRAESAADARALALTDDPAAAVARQRGWVVEDLVDPDPPTWVRLLSTHPTSTERILRAVAFAEERGLDPVPTSFDGGPGATS